jgi:DNA-binding GntR family transcriptional regulator
MLQALTIDKFSPVPMYHQLAVELEGHILGGALLPGTKLESEPKLASLVGVSLPTIRQAIDQLVKKGLLVRRRGVGSIVVIDACQGDPLASIYDELQKSGRRPTTKVISFIAQAPGDSPEAPAYSFTRTRSSNSEPVALLRNEVFGEVYGLCKENLESRGFQQILREANVGLRSNTRQIGAVVATEEEASMLGVRPGTALVEIRQQTLDRNARIISIGHHLCRADAGILSYTLSAS